MLVLKELITIIAPQKIKNIKILGGLKSKVRQFYKGISEENITDEETAIALLFPDANNQKQAYADIKRATRKSLIDALFIINYRKDLPAYRKNYISCLKYYTAARILLNLGSKKGAINIIEKTLNKTIINEFTELALPLSRDLLNYHSLTTGNTKQYYKTLDIVHHQQRQYNKEIIVKNCYTELIINLKDSKKSNSFHEILDKNKKIAEENIDEKNSLNTIFYAYSTLVIYHEIKTNFDEIVYFSEEAINVILKKKYPLPYIPFLFFYSKSIPYALQNRQWDKAKELIDKCLNLLPNKTYNYHAILIYRVMLGFHSRNYQLAYEALKLHKKAKLDAPLLKEQWQIIEAWIMLFAGWGKIDLDGEKPNFRVFKFINSVPNFIKDKPGHNSIIQLLKFLFFFQKERYEELYDMSTPFKLYAHRYLKPKINARTRYIIRTVCAVADEGFHKKLGIQKATNYYEKLKGTQVNFLEQKTVEIVPFELVADTVFENL